MGIGAEFLRLTRYEHLDASDQVRGVPPPPLERPPAPHAPILALPRVDTITVGTTTVREAIERRRSVRDFAHTSIPLEVLAWLLWATQGVKKVIPGQATLRTVPSAGACHAFETFLAVHRVDGCEPGLYRYLALSHSLQACECSPEIAHRLVRACLGQPFVGSSAVSFVWAAVPSRMTWRYGERGYRYLLLDAGHVCENLYLAAEAVGLGLCAVAAFDDDAMNRLVGADGTDMFVTYVAAVGSPRRWPFEPEE